eukprot:scaffold36529_cov62-Phaeocystis_antarctica.AAC.3
MLQENNFPQIWGMKTLMSLVTHALNLMQTHYVLQKNTNIVPRAASSGTPAARAIEGRIGLA